MENIIKKELLLISVSAILYCCAITYSDLILLGLVSLSPSFYVLFDTTRRKSFLYGGYFGIVVGGVLLFWMNTGITLFTQGSSSYGIVLYLLSVIITSLFFAIIFWSIKWITEISKGYKWYTNAITFATVWVIIEMMHNSLFEVIAWMGFYPGITILNDTLLLQYASIGGLPLLSMIVVIINFLVAHCFKNKWKEKTSLIFISFLATIHLLGFGILKWYDHNVHLSNALIIGIINENYPPGTQWNEKTGDRMVLKLIEDNKQIQEQSPHIILWCEAIIPWTYKEDDDFIKEIQKNTRPDILQIMGITTEYQDNIIYNSSYLFDFENSSKHRYDKTYLIPLAEYPVSFISLPYLNSDGYHCQPGSKTQKPLSSRYGNIGIVLCNETMVSQASRNMTKQGAEFFLIPGNDAWFFEGEHLLNQHFNSCRLRAVENRKDYVVNNNMGYSGAFNARGELIAKFDYEQPILKTLNIFPNNYKSFYSNNPNIIVYLNVLLLILSIIINKKLSKTK